MRRSAFISFLSLLLVFACVSPGQAETRKLNLIFIGGDSDTEESKNNLFRTILLNNEAFQEDAQSFFIRSAGRDYSNDAAIQRTEAAVGYLSDHCMNVVGGYSHGGQSIFFIEMDKISEIYLIDACVSIRGICSDPEMNGIVWANWIVSTVRQGVNVHLLVSVGMRDEPSGSRSALNNMKKLAAKDPSLIPLNDGWYCAVDENGKELGRIETALLACNHNSIISLVEDQVARYIYEKWQEPVN